MLPVAILAGGLATRLRPKTDRIPKALIEINGEPFLAHQLRLLKGSGAERVVICAGYLGEQIREFAGNGSRFGLKIEYSFDGDTLLGTAGALRRALPMLGERFLVLYGDSYLPCEYRAIEDAFLVSGKLGLMTVFRNENRWGASNIEFSEGRVVSYDKAHLTARMHHIDYGLEAFHRSAFADVPQDHPCDLVRICQDLLHRDELAGYEVGERFYEIGSLEGIQELETFLSASKRRAVFLDRDGVLNESVVRDGRPYPPDTVEQLRIVDGAAAALKKLRDAGFLLIVVTNQPDVATGKQSRAGVEALNSALRGSLPLDDFYICFHVDADGCTCRKPKPGLLLEAAERGNIDLARSFMIGDRWRDVDAGATAGCRTVLIDYGYRERPPEHAPDHRATSLTDAADWVLNTTRL
jgi:histidinol-phosphate phosphatase family protein